MKYFLFDIGRVLVDFDYQQFLDAVSQATRKPCGPLLGRDLEMHNAVETGEISDAQWVDYLNQSMGVPWTLGELTNLWSRIFTANSFGRALFDDAKRSKVPVYLLSNIAKHHVDAIENNWPGIFDDISGKFFSYQIGVRKPHPDIYRHALNALDVEGSQCFFIDDLPDNIEAARSFGINAHPFASENLGTIREAARTFFDW
jgi:FMN phosphatase YigB (HAD superfamily)